jgi:hypothetical protein
MSKDPADYRAAPTRSVFLGAVALVCFVAAAVLVDDGAARAIAVAAAAVQGLVLLWPLRRVHRSSSATKTGG